MSDFFLDCRPPHQRCVAFAEESLRFFGDTKASKFDDPLFSLVLTRTDDSGLWNSFEAEDSSVFVALCGRVALSEGDWETGRRMPDAGGLACKVISILYKKEGSAALSRLNGNFTVIVFDRRKNRILIQSDRCGAAPLFVAKDFDRNPVVSSHPDLLASAIDAHSDFDQTSLAEFLSVGKVSYPFTYYSKVLSGPHASCLTIDFSSDSPSSSVQSTFDLTHRADETSSEAELAEGLGEAFKAAVRRRVQPTLGRTIVSLSGGLDSRMILASCPEGADVQTISFFDQENLELRIARRIAETSGVPHFSLQRKFEHYGSSAALGVRISGGMASFASNHFLGFRDRIQDLKPDNLLTGCYCDYLFKGLALNRKVHPILRSESFGKFSFGWYRPRFELSATAQRSVDSRLNEIFPEALRAVQSDEAILEIERKRLFPLSYEPDSLQRVVPQRVLPWYVPAVDNDVLDVYLRIPPRYKLNTSLFTKMVRTVCGDSISSIPDANTGVPVNAGPIRQTAALYASALRNRFQRKVRPNIATSGSWPNWEYYVRQSDTLASIWRSNNEDATEQLSVLLGYNPFDRSPHEWVGTNLELFLRIITLKLWFGARIGTAQRETISVAA